MTSKVRNDQEVLKELADHYREKGNGLGQFAVAQKMYEEFDDGKMLIKCYFEGIGTEKDIQKGREVQRTIIYDRMIRNNGAGALSTWCSWWKGKDYYPDLEAMLAIARKFCNDRNPLGIGFMEEVQLALVGQMSESSLADGSWRNRLGYEPYALYHNFHEIIGENKLPEERCDIYNNTLYLIDNKCVYVTADSRSMDALCKDNVYAHAKNTHGKDTV